MSANPLEEDFKKLAEGYGYLIEEVTVQIGDGETRPGWLVFDLASRSFVGEAVNWTTINEVDEYLYNATE